MMQCLCVSLDANFERISINSSVFTNIHVLSLSELNALPPQPYPLHFQRAFANRKSIINHISTKIYPSSLSHLNALPPQPFELHFQNTIPKRISNSRISRLPTQAFRQENVTARNCLLASKVSAETSINGRLDAKNVQEQEQEHITRLENMFDANGLALEVEKIEMTEDNDMVVDENLLKILTEKCARVVDAAAISSSSRILVCAGNEILADQLSLAMPDSVDMFHYSIEILARIKEKHDSFRCWHGELEAVLQDSQPYDVVFLNFMSAIAFGDEAHLFQEIVHSCKPGAMVVISHMMGSSHLQLQREGGLSLILRDLPSIMQLKVYCTSLHMELLNFHDEPDFYLATLKVS